MTIIKMLSASLGSGLFNGLPFPPFLKHTMKVMSERLSEIRGNLSHLHMAAMNVYWGKGIGLEPHLDDLKRFTVR